MPELEQFLAALPEPTFVVSGDGEILLANRAACELLSAPRHALTGRPIASLVTDPAEKVQDDLRLWSRSRQMLPGSLTWRRGSGGEQVETRCEGSVVRPRTESAPAVLFVRCRAKADASDQFALLNGQIAALSREVIERRKAERQRDELLEGERAARREAERNSRMKDEFLSTLSHELRTPLNAILGWTQLLRQSGTGGDAGEGLAIIERNARVQKQLIEDLLDMSRIISGKVRLEVQRVDPASVIEAAAEALRPAAEAKQIRLQLALDPLAGPVKGDPGRLQQVVWNLLSNAIKFTPKGGRVQMFLERVNSHVELTVSDTGSGIRPEFLPHVFDRFRQADATTTRRHGGLGLGLSIVKQLVELHGGTVRAKSPGEGQGATFVVDLPLMVLHEHPESPETARPVGAAGPGCDDADVPSLQGVTILVVDDEPDARELVSRLLHGCGAEVATAGSAADALRILAGARPHVLVSDIGMPGVDGYELMRRVRALGPEHGGRVPAVALTAFARSEDRTRAMLAGYNVHLSKPLEPSELIATVASMAGRTGTS